MPTKRKSTAPGKKKRAGTNARKSEAGTHVKHNENRKWVSDVKTVSTFPPEGTFSQDAETIAQIMASEKVSPKGLGSAIRMVQYFINRGGHGLTKARLRELEKAKHLLQEKAKAEKAKAKQAKKALG